MIMRNNIDIPSPPGGKGPMRKGNRLLTMFAVFIFAFALTALYEALKQHFFPEITLWQSHFMTMVFCSLVAVVSSVLVLRHFSLLNQKLAFAMTESLHTQHLLRENLSFLQQLINDIPIPVVYTSGEEVIAGCNNAFEQLVGNGKADMSRNVIASYLPVGEGTKGDVNRLYADFRKEGNIVVEIRDHKFAQGLKSVLLVQSPYASAEGERLGYICVVIDITERLLYEDKLISSERFKAISILAGGIAHQFNNQLTAVIGNAQLLTFASDDHANEKYRDNIVKAAKRSAKMVSALLDYSKVGVQDFECIDIHAVIEELIPAFSHFAGNAIAIETDLKADNALVSGNRLHIFTALYNIADNARDAIQNSGTIRFETETTAVSADRPKENLPYGEYISISVSDTGSGMDDEVVRCLFEPFYTTKREGKGVGIGLSIVYETIRKHKGLIEVSSEKGKGSRFTILLPLYTSR